MLKKTLLAGATAAVIAVALAPSIASASPWSGGGYNGGSYHPQPQQCTPITKTTKWWDRWGHQHSYTQVVGQKCVPMQPPAPPHHGPFFPPHGNWGWGGW